ncbi:MAG: GNAT family N-acetyltransferase [Bifidobacterium sp.]|nr:GNAT family N-acetyltransferase [Bifidobacterium sp.]
MPVREAMPGDLDQLLALYLHLHEQAIPEDGERLRHTWQTIMEDPDHHILVYEAEGRVVSSCVCVIIPNLTRGVRPYAFVENVVTDAAWRGRGYATACLDAARGIARRADCYKMMLLTGSTDPATHRFYRNAGYNSSDKTAFIQWL